MFKIIAATCLVIFLQISPVQASESFYEISNMSENEIYRQVKDLSLIHI